MKTILKTEVENKMQKHYDGLKDLSNKYFAHSGESENTPYQYGWKRKAQTMDDAADLLVSACADLGIYLNTSKSDHQLFTERELQEEYNSIDLDVTEAIYHEEES